MDRSTRLACRPGLALCGWLWAVGLGAAEAPRFAGEGELSAPVARSEDGRYALQAALRPGDGDVQGGRFGLDARLTVSDAAKSSLAVCTVGGDLFRNGFE